MYECVLLEGSGSDHEIRKAKGGRTAESVLRRNRMSKTSDLLKEFEELCKFVREVHCDDTVCGYCEYDCGTVGEEPMECPGFETDECFKLKEEFKKKYLGETEW